MTDDLAMGRAERHVDPYAEGMRVRREILGDAHVQRAEATKSEFTADFQSLITRYAWGEIWARPGLDRRSRSLILLTTLIARASWDELSVHVVAARGNGVSVDEIKELILQCAVYTGVPTAHRALAEVRRALEIP